MKRQISLKLLLVVVSIVGTGAGLYVRTLQPEPIRYSTLNMLIANENLDGMEIVRGLPEIGSERFEVRGDRIQVNDLRVDPGSNLVITVRDSGVTHVPLSDRAGFVDIDHIHIAFLVRPENKDVFHWLIFKGPTWDELKMQDICIDQWRQRNRNKRGRN